MQHTKILATGSKNISPQELETGFRDGAELTDTANTQDPTPNERLFHQVFGIPLILKEILKLLPFPDLLTASLVNKTWNFFSREILREMNTLAEIEFENSCSSLHKLNELLEYSDNVPFNGLYVALASNDESTGMYHTCITYDDPSVLSCHVLSKICVKYLQIQYIQENNCVAVDLIRKILAEHAQSLEVLSLDALSHGADFSSWMRLNLTGHWLPNVHLLQFERARVDLHNEFVTNNIDCSIIQELIQAAPNLREIWGYIHPYCLEPILKMNFVHGVADFHYRPPPEDCTTRFSVRKFALNSPELDKFCFTTQVQAFGEKYNVGFSKWSKAYHDEVAQNVKEILLSSEITLTSLHVDQLSLILMITRWNIPVMKRVNCLSIWYSLLLDSDSNVPMLSKLDWSRNFPNLKAVRICYILFEPDTDIHFYLNENFRHSTAQFVCKTVREFRLEGYNDEVGDPDQFDLSQLQLFGNLFPNVKNFFAFRINQFPELMSQLWMLWPDLEDIQVHINMDTPFRNFDDIFTGLSSAETCYVYKNFEDAKSLEIVPVKPCLLNLKRLKSMKLNLYHPNESCELIQTSGYECVFLSRVTGHCAVSRIPNLEVTIVRETCVGTINCPLELNHLKPFATICSGTPLHVEF